MFEGQDLWVAIPIVKFFVGTDEQIRDMIFVSSHTVEDPKLHVWPSFLGIKVVLLDTAFEISKIWLHAYEPVG